METQLELLYINGLQLQKKLNNVGLSLKKFVHADLCLCGLLPCILPVLPRSQIYFNC